MWQKYCFRGKNSGFLGRVFRHEKTPEISYMRQANSGLGKIFYLQIILWTKRVLSVKLKTAAKLKERKENENEQSL